MRDAEGRGFIGLAPPPALKLMPEWRRFCGGLLLFIEAKAPASLRGLGRAPDYRPTESRSAVGQRHAAPAHSATSIGHFVPRNLQPEVGRYFGRL